MTHKTHQKYLRCSNRTYLCVLSRCCCFWLLLNFVFLHCFAVLCVFIDRCWWPCRGWRGKEKRKKEKEAESGCDKGLGEKNALTSWWYGKKNAASTQTQPRRRVERERSEGEGLKKEKVSKIWIVQKYTKERRSAKHTQKNRDQSLGRIRNVVIYTQEKSSQKKKEQTLLGMIDPICAIHPWRSSHITHSFSSLIRKSTHKKKKGSF